MILGSGFSTLKEGLFSRRIVGAIVAAVRMLGTLI